MRLLLCEDERDISKALVTIFEKNNYSTDAVYNGDDALSYALCDEYDGIVLDIMMPKMDGIEVLRRLRAEGIQTPVIMLTAKGELEDRVTGLDAGADDYLAKPFAASELLARVRAMLRRKSGYSPDVLCFDDLSLDRGSFELFCEKKSVRLVNREFQVMEMLMENPGQIISTDRLMEHIWGWDSDVEVSIVWVTVSNLRKKLTTLGSQVTVRAVRGVGYQVGKA